REQAGALAPVNGSLVFIGSVATKVANDIVATSVHPETPGVFVHAAIAWSVLSGVHLVPAHPAFPPAVAALLGVLGVVIGRRLSQLIGLCVVVGLCVLWFVSSSYLLDARLGLGGVIALALLALFVVWLARATYRSLVELRARRLTEERFKSYVAPDVVDILVSNPALSSMEPQRRELTIMFTDIAGFTTMAERLGTQRTTDVLSEYLASMTDVLESTGATLDKYLGDGIMAFWGAPLENERHAQSACEAAVRMLDALDGLNERGVFGEVGPAEIRIGIATGVVSVGDFGNPPLRSAYTVIGDTVNLAARLESANKQLGASICINARCAELLGDEMRTRAVGPLVVVGKSQPEPIRELLGDRRPHGDRTDAWVALHESASSAFLSRRWDEARAGYERLRDGFGDEKIATLHLEAIERLAGDGVTPPSIELTEK
ncbi:MAG: adenylate/guanylate cyclase domain-containing protein, partial [Planctomycetota bacterium]